MSTDTASALASGTQYFHIIVALGIFAACANASDIKLSAIPERPVIIAGEPLFVAVTVENISPGRLLVRTEAGAFSRMTIGPHGFGIAGAEPAINGVSAKFYKEMAAGSKETTSLVAVETAALKLAGEYHMTIRQEELGATCELSFTVKPYDQAAIRARAIEISEGAANVNDKSCGLDQTALAAFDPAVSANLLCTVLMRNHESYIIAWRLEQLGDEGSINCLITVLPTSNGLNREVIVGTLERLVKMTRDNNLRDKINQALQNQ